MYNSDSLAILHFSIFHLILVPNPFNRVNQYSVFQSFPVISCHFPWDKPPFILDVR